MRTFGIIMTAILFLASLWNIWLGLYSAFTGFQPFWIVNLIVGAIGLYIVYQNFKVFRERK